MKRQVITGTGRWFDVEAAECWEEDTYWDGRNHISKATGSQWNHETLYRSKSGNWIVHYSSQMQGTPDRWGCIDDQDAYVWLSKNNHADDIPETELGKLEV